MLKNIIIEENQYIKIFSQVNGLDIEIYQHGYRKLIFRRTQTDLIAISPDGEQVVFIDYFTNFDFLRTFRLKMV